MDLAPSEALESRDATGAPSARRSRRQFGSRVSAALGLRAGVRHRVCVGSTETRPRWCGWRSADPARLGPRRGGRSLAASAIVLFRRAGTSPVPIQPTTALVVRGPYRLTRNPMYLGLAALYAAVAPL